MINLEYPKKPEDFIGGQQQRLASVLSQDVPQVLLLVGQSGIGKTSLLKYLIHQVLRDVYVTELNCVESAGVAKARAIADSFYTRPVTGQQYKVYLLDELHGWSGTAQEALLTALENLPQNVYVFAASTRPDKIEKTLGTRFTTYQLNSPTLREQGDWLKVALFEEAIGIEGHTSGNRLLTKSQATQVVYEAAGSIRQLKRLALQVINETYTPADLETDEATGNLVDALLYGKGNPFAMEVVSPEGAVIGLCRYARKVLVKGENERALRILQVFGGGLPSNIPPDIGLAYLISKYVQE